MGCLTSQTFLMTGLMGFIHTCESVGWTGKTNYPDNLSSKTPLMRGFLFLLRLSLWVQVVSL
jgi:hypothetical protein